MGGGGGQTFILIDQFLIVAYLLHIHVTKPPTKCFERYGLCHKKTCFLQICENKGRGSAVRSSSFVFAT